MKVLFGWRSRCRFLFPIFLVELLLDGTYFIWNFFWMELILDGTGEKGNGEIEKVTHLEEIEFGVGG